MYVVSYLGPLLQNYILYFVFEDFSKSGIFEDWPELINELLRMSLKSRIDVLR
jgi:hypothetical protein